MAQTLEVTLQTGSRALPVILGESTESVSVKMRTEATYYNDGYEKGQEKGREDFIENELPSIKSKEYYGVLRDTVLIRKGNDGTYALAGLFGGRAWDDKSFSSVIEQLEQLESSGIKNKTIVASGLANYAFINSYIEDLSNYTIDVSKSPQMVGMFKHAYTQKIPKIDLSGVTKGDGGGGRCLDLFSSQNIISVAELVVPANVSIQSAFTGATNLQSIKFSGEISGYVSSTRQKINLSKCQKLNAESLKSLAQTLALHDTDQTRPAIIVNDYIKNILKNNLIGDISIESYILNTKKWQITT